MTAQNAARTLPLLVERGVTTAVVVCAPLHLYRTRFFFAAVYGGHAIETQFHVARVPPSASALLRELVAMPVRRRHLRSAKAELARKVG